MGKVILAVLVLLVLTVMCGIIGPVSFTSLQRLAYQQPQVNYMENVQSSEVITGTGYIPIEAAMQMLKDQQIFALRMSDNQVAIAQSGDIAQTTSEVSGNMAEMMVFIVAFGMLAAMGFVLYLKLKG
jgi:predicted PurR-regulated permease PerM